MLKSGKIPQVQEKINCESEKREGTSGEGRPLNWGDRVGKCLGGRKKGEGGMGLDQRPGNQCRGGFSPWLLRGKTEDRGDARETQAEGTRDGRVGKGGKRSKRLAATGVKPADGGQ